jgi:hypothetical protein
MAHGPWSHKTLMAMVLRGRCNAQDIVNVFHFEASAVEDATFVTDELARASAAAMITDWRTNLMPAWLACATADYTLPIVSVQVLERNGLVNHKLSPSETTYTTGIAGTYTATSAGTSISAAGVIRWKSTLAGKSHRGRTYLVNPPPAGTGSNLGNLVSNAKALYETFADAMIARYAPSGTHDNWNFTVYSRPYDVRYDVDHTVVPPVIVARPAYDGNSTFITARQVDTVLRQQRKRELGVGS